MTCRIDRLASAIRQAAGVAGNTTRGNLLCEAADCLEECRDLGALLAQAIAERNQALEERAEANQAACKYLRRIHELEGVIADMLAESSRKGES